MANTKSAAKRARQIAKRTQRNRSTLSRIRTMQKRSANPDETRALISAIDKAAKRGVIHKNTATRRKARLAKQLASQPAATS
jgi:small subunit ribosomal protein S20